MVSLAIFATASLFAGIAHAATGLTIQPVKISQQLNPGQSVDGTILLTNASSEDVVVDVNIEDFVPTAGTETFQFVGRAPGVTSVRDWISIEGPAHFDFKQGESKEISYTIKAPTDAEPGSHFGVLFFKATNAADAGAQIKVGTQVGVLAFITIPGKFEQKGVISDFRSASFVQSGPVHFDLSFQNTGTVYFEPKGTIDISNMFGSKIASVPIEGYAVLPTGVKTMGFDWNVKGFLLGKYKAVASIVDTDGNVLTTQTTSFYAVPVWYIVGFIVILLLIFFVIRFLRKKVSFSVKLK